ncbi:SpoIID/LytB domain-containing protein [Desulfobotulus mexicanus]|nr:SpoIID/LytB domain-containing protein [Desulfobotulus mexicanus]
MMSFHGNTVRKFPFYFICSFLCLLLLRPLSVAAMPEEVTLALNREQPVLALHILRSWSAVSESSEDRAKALWMEARIHSFYFKDFSAAEVVLDRALEKYPGTRIQGDIRFEKAVLAMERGDKERAFQAFAEFVSLFPDHPRRESAGAFWRYLKGEEPLLMGGDGIRVALSAASNRVQLIGKELRIRDMVTGNYLFSGDKVVLQLGNDGSLRLNGRVTGQPLMVEKSGEFFTLDGCRQRGTLRVSGAGGRLLLVNMLDMESYLKGVVPAEMPPFWPAEALKAQAVAARTYALHHMRERAYEAYDVKSDVRSQVFSTEREDARSSAAVEATRGEVLVWAGQAALTAFHADSGGFTESAEILWGGELPYLRAVSDPWSRNTPNDFWECSFTERELVQFLPELRNLGRILEIRLEGKTPSGRVHFLIFKGSRGDLRMPAGRFRTRVGPMTLKSTDFTLRHERGAFHFQGKGFGHGVGMSQWGARRMAEAGKSYREILDFYYPHLHRGKME